MRLWNLLLVLIISFLVVYTKASCAESLGSLSDIRFLWYLYGTDITRWGSNTDYGERSGVDELSDGRRVHWLRTRISVDELIKQNHEGVAKLWGNRRAQMSSDGKDGLKVFDPRMGKQELPLDQFRQEFTGQVLLVSKDPITLPVHQTGPVFVPEWYVYDFGDTDHGNIVDRTLHFINAGDSDLKITNARTTCGCASTTLKDSVVHPGQSSEIHVTISTLGRQGTQDYTLYVNSNDPVTPIAKLGIVGSVVLRYVSVYPEEVSFGTVPAGSARFVELQVNDSGGRDFTALSARSDLPFVKCSLFTISNKRHPRYMVVASLSPDAPVGCFCGYIALKTTHPKEPLKKIVVRGEITNSKVVEIPADFGAISCGKAIEKIVPLAGDQSLSVQCAENSLPHVSVKLQRAGSNGMDVIVSIDDLVPADSKIAGPVILRTNDPARPLITLQVYARVVSSDVK